MIWQAIFVAFIFLNLSTSFPYHISFYNINQSCLGVADRIILVTTIYHCCLSTVLILILQHYYLVALVRPRSNDTGNRRRVLLKHFFQWFVQELQIQSLTGSGLKLNLNVSAVGFSAPLCCKYMLCRQVQYACMDRQMDGTYLPTSKGWKAELALT